MSGIRFSDGDELRTFRQIGAGHVFMVAKDRRAEDKD
jgi:hypothetical protein